MHVNFFLKMLYGNEAADWSERTFTRLITSWQLFFCSPDPDSALHRTVQGLTDIKANISSLGCRWKAAVHCSCVFVLHWGWCHGSFTGCCHDNQRRIPPIRREHQRQGRKYLAPDGSRVESSCTCAAFIGTEQECSGWFGPPRVGKGTKGSHSDIFYDEQGLWYTRTRSG